MHMAKSYAAFFLLPFLCILASAQNNSSDFCPLCDLPRFPPNIRSRYWGCFSNIYAFGNSLEDTGNLAQLQEQAPSRNLSNGITWPGCPTGRFSDGRLFVDYYAEAFKVDYSRPWTRCTCGTNFAIGGATALTVAELQALNITTTVPYSLSDQLDWYGDYLQSCSPIPGLTDPKALFLLEIGGDDYFAAITSGYTPDTIISQLVDRVVDRVISAVQLLLSTGVRRLLVENIPQPSCTPLLKALLGTVDQIENGCLVNYGRIVETHNRRLREQLFDLSIPKGTVLAIEDRYGEFFQVWNNTELYGIVEREDACCGGDELPYNALPICGTDGAMACPYPRHAFYWDFVHFTDEFDRIAINMFLEGKYLIGPLGYCNVFDLMCLP